MILKTRREHLRELKAEFIRLVIPMVVCFMAFFALAKPMVNYILGYYQIPITSVVSLTPFESLQTCLSIAGSLTLLFCLPLILNGVLRYSKEVIGSEMYKKSTGLIFKSYGLAIIGVTMGIFIFSKLILNNLMKLYTLTHATWSILAVFNLIIVLSIGLGITMQMVIIIPSSVNIGLIEKERLKKIRPFALVLILIASAIITPPDVLSMLILSVPIYGAYETGLLLSKSNKEVRKC